MIKYANTTLAAFFFREMYLLENYLSAEKSYFFFSFFFSASSIFNDGLLYSRLSTTQLQSSLLN